MSVIAELMPHIGLRSACRAFALNRGFVYRVRHWRRPTVSRRVRRSRARRTLAFSIAEQNLLLGLLSSERFLDMAPAAVFTTLLDEGQYYGSIRTMYRVLSAVNQTGERRRQRIHPTYAKPELLAIAPNEVWSWDISKQYAYPQNPLSGSSRRPRGWQAPCLPPKRLYRMLFERTLCDQE